MTVAPSDTLSPLAELLFGATAGATPLFRSALYLADYIVEHDDEYKGKKPKSLSTFIHQVTRGERSCPQKLKLAIEAAIRAHVEDETLRERTVAQLDALLLQEREDEEQRIDPKLTLVSELWAALVSRAETARSQFIITARPAEQERLWQAERLSTILLNRLNLTKEKFELPDAQYTFCFPDRGVAEAFWFALRAKLLQSGLSYPEVTKRLKHLNDEKHRHLAVWTIPAHLCAIPVVVFNPDAEEIGSEPEHVDGYVLFYHPKHGRNEVSVARMDEMSLSLWIAFVYNAIPQKRIDVENIEFRG